MREKEKKGEEMSGDRKEEEPSPPKLKICVRHCLPTRREDHATHPTDHVRQGGTHVNRSQQGLIIEIFTSSLRIET